MNRTRDRGLITEPVHDTCWAVDVKSVQAPSKGGPLFWSILVDPGQDRLVIFLCESARVENAGEPVESLDRETQMRILEAVQKVEPDQLSLQHQISVRNVARTLETMCVLSSTTIVVKLWKKK